MEIGSRSPDQGPAQSAGDTSTTSSLRNRSTLSFLLRLWPEVAPGATDGQECSWRCEVQHIQTGDRRAFRDLASLVEFINGKAGAEVFQIPVRQQSGISPSFTRLEEEADIARSPRQGP